MSAEDLEILEVFRQESTEHLSDVENDILEIERGGADPEIVGHLFRAVHTVKGGAGFLKLENIGKLSHHLENIVDKIRSEILLPSEKISEVLLKGIDKLQYLLNNIEDSNNQDISEELADLDALLSDDAEITLKSENKENKDVELKSIDTGPFNLNNYDWNLVIEQKKYVIICTFNTIVNHDFSGRTVKEIINEIKNNGTLIDIKPDLKLLENLENSNIEDSNLNDISFILSTVLDDIDFFKDGLNIVVKKIVLLEPMDLLKYTKKESPQKKQEKANTSNKERTLPSKRKDSTLRVPLPVLDKLMNLAGELVLVRNQNMQAVATADIQNITSTSKNLNVVTSELQESIMQTRMQPIGTVFNRFVRIVRDLSKKLDKEIDLEIIGSEVELDKSIIESIGDPLTHLIRNAVDHGIEDPISRLEKGKDPCGNLKLKAFHASGQINIQITDDGKGMDPDILKKSAILKDLITKEKAELLTEKEAFKLIFYPGFSTAGEVSDISGRGVGMDVVKSSFQKLGGIIDIDSEINTGTTITIKLPLTLAIIPSLIVSVENICFAIPQMNIIEIVWLHGQNMYQDIKTIGDQEVYWLRNKMLKLVRLSNLFNIKKTYEDHNSNKKSDRRKQAGDRRNTTDEANFTDQRKGPIDRRVDFCNSVYIVVIKLGKEEFGLIVDQIVDTEEIVVKPLHKQLKKSGAFSGTAVLGDGRIALIIDINSLAETAALGLNEIEERQKRHASQIADDNQPFLLFSLNKKEKFAVPVQLIKRVEPIKDTNIKDVKGREYIDYRNNVIPIIRPEHVFHSIEAEYKEEQYAIIPAIHKPIGIMASEIIDTINIEPEEIDTETISKDGVLGSVLFNDEVILIVDLFYIIEKVEPSWITAVQCNEKEGNRILFVDDSKFFRTLVSSYLTTANYKVLHASNGKEAINLLKAESVDLIISDLNMPVMDGFEFAKFIRAQKNFKNIPMIALSSMNEIDGQLLAKEVGYNEFKSKQNKEAILETISNLKNQTVI